MAVGFPAKTTYANGDVFSASDINDTNGTLNLAAGAQWAAGKNKIINGDFYINQRNFTSVTSTLSFTFDRWKTNLSGGTVTYTPQTFSLGAAPVSGYEGATFLQVVTSGQSAAGDYAQIYQPIESVRTFAGQTVTFSFWAKASSGTPKIATEFTQFFGSGGSPSSQVNTYGGQVTISTSWARYSVTVAIPSISGKTLGTDKTDRLESKFWFSAGSTFDARTGSLGIQNNTFQVWGVQVEAGSTATAFQTATGTIQGELAACQRYYVRYTCESGAPYAVFAPSGLCETTTQAICYTSLPVQLRSYPTTAEFGGSIVVATPSTAQTVTGIAIQDRSSAKIISLTYTVASGLTIGQIAYIRANNSSTAYLGFSAEL